MLPTLSILACVRIDLSPPAPLTTPIAVPQSTPTFRPTNTPLLLTTSAALAIPVPSICPLLDLQPGQFISASNSYTQTEPAASGRMTCRIKRDTCVYQQLVGLADPSIVFKQEEAPPFGAEDILMHPAMVQPLARLNELVQAEWEGAVQLRVTDAYDSLLEHDPPQTDANLTYSLHYEGRAIDLTIWPIDRSRYGRLCSLAHCAGFNWVLHEGTHCHASVRGTSLCTQCSD